MRVLAYVDARYEAATRAVVGPFADVLTAPPLAASVMSADILSGHEVLYLDLHGQPGSVYLYFGEGARQAALAVATVRAASLHGTVVIATTCYLPQTPFLAALLGAGAAAVIAGDGENYAGRTRVAGAQLLARLAIKRLQLGYPAPEALAYAQRVLAGNLRLRLFQPRETADTLAFRVFLPEPAALNGRHYA